MSNAHQLLGVGVYTVADASRLTKIPRQRIQRWIDGNPRNYRGQDRLDPPLITKQLPKLDGETVIGFLNLMELRFIDAFRRHNVSLQAIRMASRKAAERFGDDHPLCSRRFFTDGKTIFADVAYDTGEQELLDLVKDQYAFRSVLQPYLEKGLEFAGDDLVRWRPAMGGGKVVLDPDRSFGQPITEGDGVPTSRLYEAFCAGDSLASIARWYQISETVVSAAIDYERDLAA